MLCNIWLWTLNSCLKLCLISLCVSGSNEHYEKMPSESTDERLRLLFVQSLKFAHVWMHKLNTFIMPDLLLCKPPAINIALMRSVTDTFYSMRHLYRLLYRPGWIIIIYNLSLSICIWNIRDEVRLRAEVTLPPFLLHNWKWQTKKNINEFAVLELECDTFKVMNNSLGTFFWQLYWVWQHLGWKVHDIWMRQDWGRRYQKCAL